MPVASFHCPLNPVDPRLKEGTLLRLLRIQDEKPSRGDRAAPRLERAASSCRSPLTHHIMSWAPAGNPGRDSTFPGSRSKGIELSWWGRAGLEFRAEVQDQLLGLDFLPGLPFWEPETRGTERENLRSPLSIRRNPEPSNCLNEPMYLS